MKKKNGIRKCSILKNNNNKSCSGKYRFRMLGSSFLPALQESYVIKPCKKKFYRKWEKLFIANENVFFSSFFCGRKKICVGKVICVEFFGTNKRIPIKISVNHNFFFVLQKDIQSLFDVFNLIILY